MVAFSMLTSAETISLRQLISGMSVARIHPGHAEKLRMLGFTGISGGESVVTERGREEARAFTKHHALQAVTAH